MCDLALRDRIAREYGVAPHLVPELTVVPLGATGYVPMTRRELISRKYRMLGRYTKMQALLRREGKL